jgi:hypothetical protein
MDAILKSAVVVVHVQIPVAQEHRIRLAELLPRPGIDLPRQVGADAKPADIALEVGRPPLYAMPTSVVRWSEERSKRISSVSMPS